MHCSLCILFPLQVRPNDDILFKQITLEEAYKACFTTDALMAAVTQVARGHISETEAEAKLDSLVVSAGPGGQRVVDWGLL
jgi:hypothetical protein